MKGHRAQLLVAVVLLAVAVFFGVRGVRKVRHVRTVDAVCTAAVRGDWPAALEKPLDVSQPTPQILRAAECRCLALMESERRPECVELMEDLVTRAPEAWLPLPDLTSVLVVDRRDRGEVPQAADLAHRGALQYPEEMLLLRLEMDLRGRIEDEVAVLKEMVHRLPLAGATAPSLGLEIAARFMAREGVERRYIIVIDIDIGITGSKIQRRIATFIFNLTFIISCLLRS